MKQELVQLENIKNIPDFKKAILTNQILMSLPVEIKQAVIDKDLSLDDVKEIIKSKDERLNKKIIEVVKRKKNYEKNIVNTAKFAVKKSELMKIKIDNLKSILNQNIILSTVWDIGKRENYAGDSSFYGNAPTQVVEQCILRLTEPKDIVLDPMVGSGTTIDVCKVLDREAIAYDLNPTRPEIIKNDSRKIPLENESVDFAFFHPPYWNMVEYSKLSEDLSKQSLNQFFESIENVLGELQRTLRPNKYMAILVGDVIENGKFIPLTRKIANIAESLGFEDCGQAIKITANSVSQRVRGKAIYAEIAATRNLKINNDYVMFWKKI